MNKYLYILLFIGIYAHSQSYEKIDSMIMQADMMIFNDPDSALEMSNKIEPLAKNSDRLSSLLLVKGGAYSAKHLSADALKYGFEAYSIAEKSKDSTMMIKSLGFIGNQYYILQFGKKAINYLDKAEKLINMQPDIAAVHHINANIYFMKGLNYKDNLDSNFAIKYFDKAIQEYQKSEDPKRSIINMSIVEIQKAYCLMDINQLDDAEKLFLKVLQTTNKQKMTDIQSFTKIGLATLYDRKKEFVKANKLLMETQKEIGQTSNINMLVEVFDALSQNYLHQNNAEKYYYYSRKYAEITNQKELIDSQSISQLLKKTNENYSRENNLNERKFWLYLIFIISFSSLILIFLFRKSNKLSKIQSNPHVR